MKIFAIDPGIVRSGIAVFEDGRLARAASPKNSLGPREPVLERARCMAAQLILAAQVDVTRDDVVLVEWPQVYQRGASRTKGDPNDLLPLAAVAGAVAALVPVATIEVVSPARWKGQVPKSVMVERVKTRLSRAEIAFAADISADGWDAVGIGLWKVGRL